MISSTFFRSFFVGALLFSQQASLFAQAGCSCTCGGSTTCDSLETLQADSITFAACNLYCDGCSEISWECGDDCISADTLLFSCDTQEYLAAAFVKPGDSLRTMTPNGAACSEVYYTFHHKGENYKAIQIQVQGDDESDPIVVSPNHLVYVGASFETRRHVMAKNVVAGDILVTTSAGAGGMVVSAVKTVSAPLVNVLTFEPALELANGVVISAHSFHEGLYGYVFYPIKAMYYMFGSSKTVQAYSQPVIETIDTMIAQPFMSVLTAFSS